MVRKSYPVFRRLPPSLVLVPSPVAQEQTQAGNQCDDAEGYQEDLVDVRPKIGWEKNKRSGKSNNGQEQHLKPPGRLPYRVPKQHDPKGHDAPDETKGHDSHQTTGCGRPPEKLVRLGIHRSPLINSLDGVARTPSPNREAIVCDQAHQRNP
jgi:hypothetical protein